MHKENGCRTLKLSVGDMLENLNKYKVVLASNSPRRKELLSGLGPNVEGFKLYLLA